LFGIKREQVQEFTLALRAEKQPAEDGVAIRGDKVYVSSPEGYQASIELGKLIDIMIRSNGSRMETGCVLPDGVKLVSSSGAVTIWVYERHPQVYSLKWIARDSPAPFGRRTKYRTVRISLPYLIVIAVFVPGKHDRIQLSNHNECFFRTSPLKSVHDDLFYPALLNCSKFQPPDGHPLSWICTAKLDLRQLSSMPDDHVRMRASLRALLHTLLETGYNFSSEKHEGQSWYSESLGIDPRISTIEKWEKATVQDPLFCLDVPWLRTGYTLGQVTERIFKNQGALGPRILSAPDIQRIVFNHGRLYHPKLPF